MNDYCFYTKLYGYTRNYHGVPYWMLTPARRIIRYFASKRLPNFFDRHPADINRKRNEDVVVSLTSFPARIGIVHLTIESLLRQTELPGKILLWLSKEQFQEEKVPERLRKLQNEIFSIRYVDGDIRSHKKFYYAFTEYPESTVITADDDVYYIPEMVSTLLETSKAFPEAVVSNITKHILFDEGGEIRSYRLWDKEVKPYDSEDMVQIGAGGVLYPPHCLNENVLRKEVFLDVAPMADDLWLNMMARLNETPVVQSKKLFLPLPINDETPSLKTINNGAENLNDKQLKKMKGWLIDNGYKDVYHL